MKYLVTFLCLCCSVVWLSAQPAPDFTITGTDGAVHVLYDDYLDQGKTVVLEIMFTTCPPCNNIAPMIEELNQAWGAGNMDVVFFSLSDKSFDNNSDVAAWEMMHGLNYHGAGQDGGSLDAVAPYKAGTYGIFLGTPTFVVIAPDGTVTYNPRGPSPSSTVDSIDVAIANTGATPPQLPLTIGGSIKTIADAGIADVSLTINNNPSNFPNYSGTDGNYQFLNVDIGSDVLITPSKTENPANGLSILDIVLIQRHLLFIDTLPNPYAFFAADVNNSGGLSILDMIFIQRLLLMVDNQFPNNDSWRFIPSDYVFPDPLNPLGSSPPNSISFPNIQMDQLEADFVGIKVGDVSGDANPGIIGPPSTKIINSPASFVLNIEDQYLEKGSITTIEVPNFSQEALAGFQFTLRLDPEKVEILGIEKGNSSNLEHLMIDESQLAKGLIPSNWFGSGTAEQGNLFTIQVKLKEAAYISDLIDIFEEAQWSSEIYSHGPNKDLYRHPLAIEFDRSLGLTDSEAPSIHIYPNPSTGNYTISDEKGFLAAADFYLYDYSGRPLGAINPMQMEKNVANNIFSIAHLPAGIYFLKIVQSDHKTLITKLLKI